MYRTVPIFWVGRFEMPSRAYLGRFNFKGGDQQKIVGNLSGGERGRLHLAKTLLQGGNVCCWTNHRMIWTWKPCVRWKMRCWNLPAA
jgi:hypothetical protein